MNFELICRVCLKEGLMKSIFASRKTDGDRKILCTDMLIYCATVTVSQEDGLPPQICISCFKKLWSAYKFRQLCENSFTFLVNYATNSSIEAEIKIEKSDDTPILPADNFIKERIGVTLSDVDLLIDTKVKDEDLVEDAQLNDCLDDGRADDGDTPSGDDYSFTLKSEDVKFKKKHKKNEKKSNTKKLSNKVVVIGSSLENASGYPCSFCPKVFKRMTRLITHQDSHMGIKRYYCDLCKKSYRSEKDHKSMHKRGFNFKCDICEKLFNTKSKLSIHIETHNKNRSKIICGLDGCTKMFVTVGGLDRHRSFHDGLKNFICHLCSRSFIDKYLLDIHLRSHNNDRRYPCSYCDKRFIQSSARIAHERRHTNTKNYHCPQCEKSFVCSSVLKRHILCHSKINSEACRFCGKKFSRLDNRKRHENVMHGVTDYSDEKKIKCDKINSL